MPFGTEILSGGGVRFRLWAPAAERVDLIVERGLGGRPESEMTPLSGGWFEQVLNDAAPGLRYRYRIDNDHLVPDPASRFQPDSVHGASEVVDPLSHDWADGGWRGRPWEETVLYELNVGAFSDEGTFEGVVRHLDHLAGIGVTAVQLMPVAAWPGSRNWGYDGAYPFAPAAALGRPQDLKALVEAAHARNLMVFLDVVYNHFGPEGNYLHLYAPAFFTERYDTPWGKAIDFESAQARPVRDFFIHNALYWLEEYGIDGLRLDAVHAIFDQSDPEILIELADAVNRTIRPSRHVHLVLENDNNQAHYLDRTASGEPRWYVAQWNDDWHHAAHVLLTGERNGYYRDYTDSPVDKLGRALAEGFVYQGEPSPYRSGTKRGEPSAHLPATAFVNFLQNHDQVGNRAFGDRIDLLSQPGPIEALLVILLLAPAPPLLFMGQEWGTERPFLYFADFEPELAAKVREGRQREFAHFEGFGGQSGSEVPDPNSQTTFERSKLDWTELDEPAHETRLALVSKLLTVRCRTVVPILPFLQPGGSYRRLGPYGLEVSWRLEDGTAFVLTANLGDEPVVLSSHSAIDGLFYAHGIPVTRGDDVERLPPWSVICKLEGAAREGADG